MSWRPRLRTVLLLVNLVILLLPVGGIAVLRLYENELIQRTESELLAQGAAIVAFCEGIWPTDPAAPPMPSNTHLQPLLPRLDIAADRVHARAMAPAATTLPPDPDAVRVGLLLSPVLERVKQNTLAGIRVVDRQGIVVASSGGDLGLSLLVWEEVRAALAGQPMSLMRRRVSDEPVPPVSSLRRGTRVRIFVALPIRAAGRVVGAAVLSRTRLDILKALYLQRQYLIIGACTLVLIVLLVTVFTSLTISRPVAALIAQADRAAHGEKGAVVPLARPGTHEVDQLSRAIAGMAAVLEQRADYIRTFASHVSHEFKTPLASMRGTIELLGEHLDSMTPDERNRFLGNLDEDRQRLERLVRRLLDFARADMVRVGEERAAVATVLEEAAERYRPGTPITLEIDPGVDTIRISTELLETVVVNLIDNARQHGGADVAIQITAAPVREDQREMVELTVADNGRGISPANAERIFTPFFTTARESGGSGLGLSIVRSLVSAHGGEVTLAPSERGALFVVRLPVR